MVWPGNFIELDLLTDLDPDSIVAIETRTDSPNSSDSWPTPSILEAVSGKICVLNDTPAPQALLRNKHFCQVRATTDLDLTTPCDQVPVITQNCTTVSHHSEAIKIDPDSMIPEFYRTMFHN